MKDLGRIRRLFYRDGMSLSEKYIFLDHVIGLCIDGNNHDMFEIFTVTQDGCIVAEVFFLETKESNIGSKYIEI